MKAVTWQQSRDSSKWGRVSSSKETKEIWKNNYERDFVFMEERVFLSFE